MLLPSFPLRQDPQARASHHFHLYLISLPSSYLGGEPGLATITPYTPNQLHSLQKTLYSFIQKYQSCSTNTTIPMTQRPSLSQEGTRPDSHGQLQPLLPHATNHVPAACLSASLFTPPFWWDPRFTLLNQSYPQPCPRLPQFPYEGRKSKIPSTTLHTTDCSLHPILRVIFFFGARYSTHIGNATLS